MAYTSASTVKTALAITVSTYDTLLGTLVTSACNWIDRYCNVPDSGFAVSADSTRQYGPDALCEDGALRLDVPILSVTSITNGDTTTMTTGQYRLEPLNATRYTRITPLSGYGFAWVTDGLVSVVGKFGWSTTCPSAVAEAATMLVGWMFKRYQAALQDATANQDLGQLIYGEAMPKQVLALLAPFRLGTRML